MATTQKNNFLNKVKVFFIILSFLFTVLPLNAVLAATTYEFTNGGEKTIKDSEGKTFQRTQDGVYIDFKTGEVKKESVDSGLKDTVQHPLYKGPWDNWNRYYIRIDGPNSPEQSTGMLCHGWRDWKKLWLGWQGLCGTRVLIKRIPPAGTTTYKYEDPNIVSYKGTVKEKTFVPNPDKNKAATMLSDRFTSSDKWDIKPYISRGEVATPDVKEQADLISPDGITSVITVHGLPSSILPINVTLAGKVYYKDTSNLFKAPVKIQLVSSSLTNAPTFYSKEDGTYKYESSLLAGKYSLSVETKIDSIGDDWNDFLEDLNLLEKTDTYLVGAASVTFGKDGKISDGNPDIVLTEEVREQSAVNEALEEAIDFTVKMAQKGIAITMGWVDGILGRGNFMGDDPGLKELWKVIRNITLSVFTLGILLIAFANVLQIDIDKYNVPRMIPKLVIATVMSYFSFLIANFLLTITAAIQVKLIESTGAATVAANLHDSGTSAYEVAKSGGELALYGLLLIIVMIMVFCAAIILCILLITRIAVLWLLIAVSPLAFMMQVMPFTEHLYMDWWNKFFKWAFMGPAVMFLLYLAAKIIGASSAAFGDPESSAIFQLLLAAILIFMATIIPFTMGGEVFKGIGIDQQSLWRQVPGFQEGQNILKNRKTRGTDRATRNTSRFSAWATNGVGPKGSFRQRFSSGVGRAVVGANKAESLGLNAERDAAYKKVFDNASEEQINEYIARTGNKNVYGKAAIASAAEKGKLNMENKGVADAVEREIDAGNKDLVKAITKEAPDAFAKAVMAHGLTGGTLYNEAMNSVNKREDKDLKKADLQFMASAFRAGGGTASPEFNHRINEITNNKGKLDKILGMKHEMQQEWAGVLAESRNVGHTDPELNGKIQQILHTNHP